MDLASVVAHLLKVINDVRQQTTMFKRSLESLNFTLVALTNPLRDLERDNDELGRPPEELRVLTARLEEGIDIVKDCSKVNWFNFLFLWCAHKDKLKQLEAFFANEFLAIIITHLARDQRQVLKHTRLPKTPEPGKSTEIVLPASDLYIAWAEKPRLWRKYSDSPDRLQQIELIGAYWLEISGWLRTGMLPPSEYEAYFVFKLGERTFGFKNIEVEVFIEKDHKRESRFAYLEEEKPLVEYARPDLEHPKPRIDGWLEVKLGRFNVHGREARELEMGVNEIKNLNLKAGLVVRGIEIRRIGNLQTLLLK